MRQNRWAFLILALLLGLVLAACSTGNDNTGEDEGNDQETEESSQEEKVLRISSISDIPTMDPILAEDNVSIQYTDTVYEGLYRLAPEGEIVSGIAIKEETEVSEDGLTYTFHLRDDAQWENGDPITAEDIWMAKSD